MSVKKNLLRSVFLLCILFLFAGAYGLVKNIAGSSLFTVRSVEIRGVMNSDREKLSALSKKLIGLSVFSKGMEDTLRTDDPWIQKITAVRALPDSVNIVVYEEKPLFSFMDESGKCYVFAGGNKRIKSTCESVSIIAEKGLSDEDAAAFAILFTNNQFLKSAKITLKDYSFTAEIDGNIVYCPYNSDIFSENFAAYKNSIRKLYKTIEYVDITIGKRIFVKGARNESSKG